MAREQRQRKIKVSCAIVGEGITEFFYFDGFRNSEKELLKEHNITLKPDKPKHPNFRDITAKAKSLLSKEFDVVFCLIDMDYINANNELTQAYNQEKWKCVKEYKNAIYFIESNPAFEFWLLLHFLFTDRQFCSCDEVIKELKKKGCIENYEKSIEFFSKNSLYVQLRDKLEIAMRNARFLPPNEENKDMPYSKVWEVFEELVKEDKKCINNDK